MKIISHRGYIDGENTRLENDPKHIQQVISHYNFDVEIDLWFIKENFYLGHDRPKIQTSLEFLIKNSNNLWIHCKNVEALQVLKNFDLNFFWHENDNYTLTSNKNIWCHYQLTDWPKNSVALIFKKDDLIVNNNLYGICTDYPMELKKLLSGINK